MILALGMKTFCGWNLVISKRQVSQIVSECLIVLKTDAANSHRQKTQKEIHPVFWPFTNSYQYSVQIPLCQINFPTNYKVNNICPKYMSQYQDR